MRSYYETIFKAFFHEHQTKTRTSLCLTQAEMSSRLMMDPRSYIDLDHGKVGCSGLTLARYLIYCCPDPLGFLRELYAAFESESDTVPEKETLFFPCDAVSYRQPMPVREILRTGDDQYFPVCPRCGISIEREYMSYCDRCGQKLSWTRYSTATIIHVPGHRSASPDTSD